MLVAGNNADIRGIIEFGRRLDKLVLNNGSLIDADGGIIASHGQVAAARLLSADARSQPSMRTPKRIVRPIAS